MAAKVCLLSANETYLLETYEHIPDCSHHLHLTNKQADQLQKHKDFEHRTVRKVAHADGRRRLTMESGRAWQKTTPRTVNGEKLGFAGLQMVAKRAGYIPLPHKQLGASRARHGKTRNLITNGSPVEATV